METTLPNRRATADGLFYFKDFDVQVRVLKKKEDSYLMKDTSGYFYET